MPKTKEQATETPTIAGAKALVPGSPATPPPARILPRRPRPGCSLSETHPALVLEWHPTLNGALTPADVTAGSAVRVAWRCLRVPEHTWTADLHSRTRTPTGCPVCSNRRLDVRNSLAALFPELAAEWHPTKNGDLRPDRVTPKTARAVWWHCANEPPHDWRTAPWNRTQPRSTGCQICRGLRLREAGNLSVLFPTLAAEWHPTKNGGVTPQGTLPSSYEPVWWRCAAAGHEWQQPPATRTQSKSGACPCCTGVRTISAPRLAEKWPAIASEWHPTRNGTLSPSDVSFASGRKAWWRCARDPDHVWCAQIASRTGPGKAGCPFCGGLRVSRATSLAARRPDLAAEWHPLFNKELTPKDVMPGSHQEAWWQCPRVPGHAWQKPVVERSKTIDGGCPRCTRWTVDALRVFVRSVAEHLSTMTPAERFVVLQQSGALDTYTRVKNVARALASGRFSADELRDFGEGRPSPVDTLLTGDDDAEVPDPELGVVPNASADLEEPSREPVAEPQAILAGLSCAPISDDEAADFLVTSAVAKLWARAFEAEELAVAEVRSYDGGGEYAERARAGFLAEYAEVASFRIPAGYAYRDGPRLMSLNLMQRLVAVRVRARKRLGNFSGTGAGKTLAAIVATRAVDAGMTLVVCPNAVVAGWAKTIRAAFPSAQVRTKTWEPRWAEGGGPRYLVMNYEQLQQPGAEERVRQLVGDVDFVVLDELHFAKQRDPEETSKRRRALQPLVGPDRRVYVLGQSATPLINNLEEGRSALALIYGTAPAVGTAPTIANCMALHQKFVSAAVRWMPRYDPALDLLRPRVECTAALARHARASEQGGPFWRWSRPSRAPVSQRS